MIELPASSFWGVIYPIASNWQVRAIVLLLAANCLTGILCAIKRRDFRLGAVADWMGPLLLLVGGGSCIQLVALAVPVEYGGIGELGASSTWLLIIAALIGKVLDNVKFLGVAVPSVLTDKPSAQVEVRP